MYPRYYHRLFNRPYVFLILIYYFPRREYLYVILLFTRRFFSRPMKNHICTIRIRNTLHFYIDRFTDAIGKACYVVVPNELRYVFRGLTVRFRESSRLRRVSSVPSFVGPRFRSVRQQPMGHVGRGTSSSPLHGGAESTRPTCSRTRTVRDVHTRNPLQEINI